MNPTKSDTNDIKFNRKFGFITQNEIVFRHTKKQTKMNFEDIRRVNLVKKRVFYTNLFFFATTLVAGISVYLNNHLPTQIAASLLAVVGVFLSFSHKFFHYRMIVKLKNNQYHTVKTNQLNKESIKQFYYDIIRKTKTKDTKVVITTTPSA